MTELHDGTRPGPLTPAAGFETITRQGWAAAGQGAPSTGRSADEVAPPAAVGSVAPDELAEVYEPLCHLLGVVATTGRAGARQVIELLGLDRGPPPFVVGVTGSVAVGKSTVAAVLQALLGRHPGLRPVEVLSTDAFLYSNAELAARGLSARKGFPESYRWPDLVAALAEVRAGADEVVIPVYSHRDYDVVPGRHQRVCRPATVIVEGLNVLQISRGGDGAPEGSALLSDLLDWSIYVDAAEEDIARWHRQRLLELHRAGTAESGGFLGWFCSLTKEEAESVAETSWSEINAVNLRAYIAPTRVRADMVLHKGADHRVSHVLVRPG